MAEIAAFKGIRYNEAEVGSLDKVTSPPYDIISPEERVYYHKLHPNNFVRLILGEEFGSDNESDNRFTRAKAYLDQWLRDGVLVQDAEPSIFIYEQRFERDGERVVRGITCAVKIHDYADKVILPHENTLAKPKSQLGRLIREAKANLDCVYGLYADEQGALDDVMARAMSRAPLADVNFSWGGISNPAPTRHILWALRDPADVAMIVDYMKDKPIAIADGHHRYETALGYRDEMREKFGEVGELPSDYTLMTIANVYQKDMTIFPTHRALANIPAELLDNLDGKLSNLFESAPSSRGSVLSDMARLGAIGMYRKGEARTLKLMADPGSLLSGSEASRKLELNVLHKLILEPALGIDDDKLRNQTHIIYTRSADEAMDLVDSGERQIAFLLNHIAVKSVLDVASAGEKMPQKATYFYPKLLSGLMLRLHATEAT